VSVAATFPADPGSVWGTLVDWERQSEWLVDAVWVRVVGDRREGTGTRVASRTRVLGVPLLTDVLEVVEWDPPRRLTLVRKGFVRGRGEWRLHPAGGETRFVWTEEIRLPIPLLGELALALYRPILRWLMGRSSAGLARTLR
jgi:hypothetical protein